MPTAVPFFFLVLSALLDRLLRSLSLSFWSLFLLAAGVVGDGLRPREEVRELERDGVLLRLPEGVRESRPGVTFRPLRSPPRPGLRPRLESRPPEGLRPRSLEGVRGFSFLTCG